MNYKPLASAQYESNSMFYRYTLFGSPEFPVAAVVLCWRNITPEDFPPPKVQNVGKRKESYLKHYIKNSMKYYIILFHINCYQVRFLLDSFRSNIRLDYVIFLLDHSWLLHCNLYRTTVQVLLLSCKPIVFQNSINLSKVKRVTFGIIIFVQCLFITDNFQFIGLPLIHIFNRSICSGTFPNVFRLPK